MSGTLIGARLSEPFGSDDFGRSEFALGDRTQDAAGNTYVFVTASAAITGEGYVCQIDEAYSAAHLTTANSESGSRVGIAQHAFTSGDKGWLMVEGVTQVRVSASCAANVGINTTATPGQLDDDGTASSKDVTGLILTTARAASAGLAPGLINNAYVAMVAN